MHATQLKNGCWVLAKDTKKYGVCAVTYANRTQAESKAAQMQAEGAEARAVQFCGSRVFYVRLGPEV
jgi:cell division protein FtsN